MSHVCDHVSFVWETISPSVKDTWNLFNGRGEDACRQSFIPIVKIHFPPVGIDALANQSVVSHKWVDPVTGFMIQPGLRFCKPRCGGAYTVGMLCPLYLLCEFSLKNFALLSSCECRHGACLDCWHDSFKRPALKHRPGSRGLGDETSISITVMVKVNKRPLLCKFLFSSVPGA